MTVSILHVSRQRSNEMRKWRYRSPLSPSTRTFSGLQAVPGQLYLVLLVAPLVGLTSVSQVKGRVEVLTMGEIRSTIDIIMEKTKDLTLTEKEKQAFRKTEIEGKMRGLLHKFLDGLMSMKAVKEEIGSLEPRQHRMVKEALVKECVDRIELGGENAPLFDLLEYFTGADTRPLRETLEGVRAEVEKQRKAREEIIREGYRDKGISGSAIVPNLRADPEWAGYLSEMEGELRRKLFSQAQEFIK